ncbi:MAG: hypothetical protein Q8J97_08590 [Flavobacteriaceae bacterium]|nr:hypothetical protein [Flavobacteriaceae bacterium]
MNEFTDQDKADILQGLNASIKRLRGKIRNDELHGRHDYNRIAWRKENIERAEVLIGKFKQYESMALQGNMSQIQN